MPDPREADRASSREREEHEVRGCRYSLSPAEMATMRQLGSFRTVVTEDLARYQYRGNTADLREDLASLSAQGLIERRSIPTNAKGEKLAVLALTQRGKELLERSEPHNSSQRYYARFVKPAEVRHDAAIYRMFQAEAERIRRAGGLVRRVVLDYELKQKVYRPLAEAKAKVNALPPLEYARRQAEIANQNKLKVVHGKILLPDLRIEYETAAGEHAHVDLELATHHYRGSHLRGKAEAGFKMYAPQDSVARLSAVFDPEFAAEIFSF